MQADLLPVAEAGDAEPAAPRVLDLLDVVDALSSHYHEHLDAILAWGWRLFCARWARMLDAQAVREVRQRAEREARDEEQERNALRRQLQQRSGGGDGW